MCFIDYLKYLKHVYLHYILPNIYEIENYSELSETSETSETSEYKINIELNSFSNDRYNDKNIIIIVPDRNISFLKNRLKTKEKEEKEEKEEREKRDDWIVIQHKGNKEEE